MKPKILVIDDEPEIAELVSISLETAGYDVIQAHDSMKGQALAVQMIPDAIILDLMMPIVDGFTLCQRLRREQRTAHVPILMLTALDKTKEKVGGFNAGADDYLTKPFELAELLVRVRALLRRIEAIPQSGAHSEILTYGPLILVPERVEVLWYQKIVKLTRFEFDILHCLLQRHGESVPLSEILKEVWGYAPDDEIESIRVHIGNLRKKLELDAKYPKYIKTVYGAGYCLELPNNLNNSTGDEDLLLTPS